MRVALILHSGTVMDEGVRIVGSNLQKGLREIVELESFTVSSPRDLIRLMRFHPDMCHFVLSYSSLSSTFIPWFVSKTLAGSRFCVSAVQPRLSRFMSLALRFFKPSHAFVQSEEALEFFREAGVDSSILWHGVDSMRFRPIDQASIRAIREKWGISPSATLITHVGALSERRGLRSLVRCTGENRTVLIIGRETTSASLPLLADLRASGVRFWTKYVNDIEEIYQMCDIYVFPTEDPESAIDMPLSIIEAVSCGCRVVSVDFRGISLWVRENGLENRVKLVTRGDEIPGEVERFIAEREIANGQSRTTLSNWGEVSRKVVETYQRVVGATRTYINQDSAIDS